MNGNGKVKTAHKEPHMAFVMTCPKCNEVSTHTMSKSVEVLTRVLDDLKRGECVVLHSGQAEVLNKLKGQ